MDASLVGHTQGTPSLDSTIEAEEGCRLHEFGIVLVLWWLLALLTEHQQARVIRFKNTFTNTSLLDVENTLVTKYVPQEQGRRAGTWTETSGPTSCSKTRCGFITVPMGGSRPFPGQRSTIGP